MKKVKKILAIAMIIATATTTCTFTGIIPENNLSVSAAEEVMKTEDGFEYRVEDNGEITITKYNEGTDTEVNIPSKIDEKPVTSIGEKAFFDCSYLKNITIPDSVTSIGETAFGYCNGLTSIIIPDSVKNIEKSTFFNCRRLIDVTLPDSITSIKDYTFASCVDLKNINIPDSVTSIGMSAFNDCYYLKSITIPDSVTSIGEAAFEGCTNLTSIKIPDSITKIRKSTFCSCSSLKNITMSNSVTNIEDYAFYGCFSLTGTIPDSVTNIGYDAFRSCASLTSIKIPDSATIIENDAFRLCSNLKNITIPNSVTSIGDGAFNSCTSLTNIIIPNSVTSIGYGAFCKCKELTNIIIPNSVTSIGAFAFNSCSNLTSIIIPDSVTSIGDYAFFYCDNLTIYGYKNSYAETYAQEQGIPFKEIQEPEQTLGITSFTADKVSPQKVGTTVKLTTDATGEGLQYKYYKYLNGNYELIKDWSSNSSITISPSTAGKYDLYVGVKDSSGKIVRKNIVFEFKEELGITNFTASKSSPQQVKTAVTLTAKAIGVTGTAKYKYYRYLNGVYAQIKDWSTSTSITIAPSIAGTYDLWVGVKDESGNIVRKNVKFVFENQNSLEISSFTADKASPQEVGTEIKLTTKVTGITGTAKYKYYRYLNGVYAQIKDWSTSTSIKIAPSIAGTYDLWVGVKDESGNIVRKSISYTVKKN